MNNRKTFMIMLAVCVAPWMSTDLFAAKDWQNLYSKIKDKYQKFEEKIADMTIIQNTKTMAEGFQADTKMVIWKKGQKFKVEVEMAMPGMPEGAKGMKSFFINDGKDTWMISPLTGKQKLNSDENMPIETSGNWWQMITDNAKLAGEEKVEGRNCAIVDFNEPEDSDNIFARLWVDKDDLVLVKGESRPIQDRKISWKYLDFRKVGGSWLMPYITQVFSDGELVSSSVVQSLKMNTGLNDAIFDASKIEVPDSNLGDMMKMMMDQNQQE